MDPWSKGDYSRDIPKANMVIEGPPEINPPSGRVPGQELLRNPISESWRRWNSRVFRKKESSSRVFEDGDKYRPKGGAKGGPTWPGCALGSPGQGVAPLWLPFRLLESSGVLEFWEFFWIFLSTLIFHLFLHCTDKNKKKLTLGTSLIG